MFLKRSRLEGNTQAGDEMPSSFSETVGQYGAKAKAAEYVWKAIGKLVQEGSDFWLSVTRDYVSGGQISVPPYQARTRPGSARCCRKKGFYRCASHRLGHFSPLVRAKSRHLPSACNASRRA